MSVKPDSLFSSIVSPLMVIDAKGVILEMNAAATESFGQDYTGRTYRDVFGFVGRDPVAACLKTGKPQHRVESFGEGGRLWGLTISPHQFDDRAKGAIIGCRDLTELRRMENALSAAERQAIIGRMSATVAHEVNNPLGAIKAHLNLIRKKLPADDQAARSLDIISSQVDRIARTVRLLLGFSRQRSAPEGAVDPMETIRTVLALFEESFQQKGIALVVDAPETLPALAASVDQIQEVLVNLMENARDVLNDGARVTVTVRLVARHAEILIEDDGPGLGEDPERVFQAFYTTKMSGTGLGLTIARRTCESVGGTLTADNRRPHGAQFRVVLPVKAGGVERRTAGGSRA